MNFVIINSIVGIFLMFSGTITFLKSSFSLKLLSYLGVFIAVIVCLNNFLGLNLILDFVVDDLNFRNLEWSFLLTMELCFAIFLLFNFDEMELLNKAIHEQMALLFFIMTGCALIVSYQNLLILFMGIEIVSIPLYILAGLDRINPKSNEASLKYFLLGALATCLLLMGICLLYGATGSFVLSDISSFTSKSDSLFLSGLLLIVVAMSFKVSAAPFHYWTPDVYEGSPVAYTSFMATIVKSFFLLSFFKLISNNTDVLSFYLKNPSLIIICLTLVIGNFTAVFQKGLKRLMAYSSISQVGFMLLAIFNPIQSAVDSLFLYSLIYSLSSIGIFAIISRSKYESVDNLKGLAKQYPMVALAFTIFLFSLSGIPLTAGFLAKYSMIEIAIKNNIPYYILFLIVICGTVSVFYYLRLVQNIYFKDREVSVDIFSTPISKTFQYLLILVSSLLILFGLHPYILLNMLNY